MIQLLQHAARLLSHAKAGGKVLVAGRLAEGTALLDDLLATGNTVHVPINPADTSYIDAFLSAFEGMYGPIAPAVCADERVGIQRFDDPNSTYVHILNYQYNAGLDRTDDIPELDIHVKDVAEKIWKSFHIVTFRSAIIPHTWTIPTFVSIYRT